MQVYTPACMPEPGVDFTGETGWVYGWGTTEMGGAIADTLRFLIWRWCDVMVTMLMQGDNSNNPEQRGLHDTGGRGQWKWILHGWQVPCCPSPCKPWHHYISPWSALPTTCFVGRRPAKTVVRVTVGDLLLWRWKILLRQMFSSGWWKSPSGWCCQLGFRLCCGKLIISSEKSYLIVLCKNIYGHTN